MKTTRKFRIGPPATGSNFFPRSKLRKNLLKGLIRGHVAFLGPRRTGKTSILKDLVANPPDGVSAVMLDLEGVRDVPTWLTRMLTEVKRLLDSSDAVPSWRQKLSSKLDSIRKQVDEISVAGTKIKLTHGVPAVESWQPVADQLLKLLKEHQLPIYFMLDEFPWFLSHVAANHTAAEVDATLNWFRALRIELTDLPARFLVTGSIGLRGLLRRLHLSSSANDFDTVEIEPLTDDEAREFLDSVAMGEGVKLGANARDRILERLGVGWPMLLATFVSELQDQCDDREITVDDVQRIYEDRMVRGNRNKYCEEMFSRITKPAVFVETERRIAQEILRAMSRSKTGFGQDDLDALHSMIVPDTTLRATLRSELEFVVETLLHDGYLHRQRSEDLAVDGRLVFASHILRDYWRHRTV